jgi:hypothetical protein
MDSEPKLALNELQRKTSCTIVTIEAEWRDGIEITEKGLFKF